MKKPEEKIIKHQEKKSCGCVLTEFGDGSKTIAPCVPCGLEATAQFLVQASQALAATAMTIRAHQSVSNLRTLLGNNPQL